MIISTFLDLLLFVQAKLSPMLNETRFSRNQYITLLETSTLIAFLAFETLSLPLTRVNQLKGNSTNIFGTISLQTLILTMCALSTTSVLVPNAAHSQSP